MNQLGIVASVQSNRTSIHTLKCVSAWMLDGKSISNPIYVRMKDRKDGNEKMANRLYNNDCILPMNQQHILESCVEANCPTQTQTDNTAVSDETYFPDLSYSPTSSEIPVVADGGDRYEAEDRNGNDGLNAETYSHEFPNTPTTTSGDSNSNDAAQADYSASEYPTTALASPQPLAEEEPITVQGNN